MRDFLNRFFRGRYGFDRFSRFLLISAIIFNVTYYLSSGRGTITFFLTLSNIFLITVVFRSLSRNTSKRYQEEIKFITATKPFRAFFNVMKLKITDRENKYIRCPQCNNYLRAPRGAGRIRITCNHCHNRFEKRV